jgi:lipopolysaccharide transport system permease protein
VTYEAARLKGLGRKDLPATIIRPASPWQLPDIREMWAYRDLLIILIGREVRVRYKQSVVGILWAIIQPLMTMIVFSVLFGRLAHMPSDGIPYPIFAFAALLPWQLFQRALTQGSASLVTFNSIMSKVYFPRLFAPLSSILSGLVDFAIVLAVLLGLMAWYRIVPGPQLAMMPVFVALLLLTALAVSLWLCALNVAYRDVEHALPFLAQIWMFVTPIVYPVSLVPEEWRWLAMMNPMASVIDGFRWALLGSQTVPDPLFMGFSLVMTTLLLVGGLYYFNRIQTTFVDQV